MVAPPFCTRAYYGDAGCNSGASAQSPYNSGKMVLPQLPFDTTARAYYGDAGCSGASAQSPYNSGSHSGAFDHASKQYFGAPQVAVQPVAYPQSLFAGDNAQPTSYPQSNGTSGQASTTSGVGAPQASTQVFGTSQASTQIFGAPKESTQVFGAPQGSKSYFGEAYPFTSSLGAPQLSTQVFGASQASTQFFGAPQEPTQVFGAPQGSKSYFGEPKPFLQTTGYQHNASDIPCGSDGGMSGQVSETSCLSQTPFLEGYSQAFVDNQLVGIRVSPYSPTTELLKSCGYIVGVPFKLTSISAMKAYSNKSHEELRLEDYQQQRNTVSASFAPAPDVPNGSNWQPSPYDFFVPTSSTPGSCRFLSDQSNTLQYPNKSNVFSAQPSQSNPSFSTFSWQLPHHLVPAVGNSSNIVTFPPQLSSCPAPPASAPTSMNQLQESLLKQREARNSPCVPKGLEIIVEKLGFNPWLQGKDNVNKDNYPIVGRILRCAEADKDADIISLAVFAVEQHNAFHEDDHYTFAKVIVACLEPIQGGRYHIVLDTKFRGPGFKLPERHYAVVLRKCTQSATQMMVLEKWLSSTTVIPPP